MIKRIPCRVVSSVPLTRSSDVLRDASGSNNKRSKIDDVAAESPNARYCVWELAADVQAGNAGSSVIYTGRSGTARVSGERATIGQMLDCYI